MVGIFEALVEQSDGLVVVPLSHRLLRQLDTADLILGGHLAFASLPRMEGAGIEALHSLLITAHLVEQGDFLEHEVVATLDQLRVLLQECQTLLVGTMQTLVELVELHQDALVVLVEVEGAFHVFQCLVLPVLLVEAAQGKIAPYGGERRVETCRQFPVLDGQIVLTSGIVETTQVIGSAGTLRALTLSGFEHDDVFGTVGETVVGGELLGLGDVRGKM